jgi:hypothetical protein
VLCVCCVCWTLFSGDMYFVSAINFCFGIVLVVLRLHHMTKIAKETHKKHGDELN